MTPADLKARRLALGLTQEALAERLGVHRVTVADWERGRYKVIPPYLELALWALEHGAVLGK